jgi:hypothetical protein
MIGSSGSLRRLVEVRVGMSISKSRVVMALVSGVVAVTSGLVTNLITSRWSPALVVALVVLVLLSVVVQVWQAAHSKSEGGRSGSPTGRPQKARASGNATVIQAGRDVIQTRIVAEFGDVASPPVLPGRAFLVEGLVREPDVAPLGGVVSETADQPRSQK